ncbi:MAG: DVUA0089 family protein [Aquabacterium sp.]|nr:DVUA0089 family protein [Aquabacterium sp.]
MPFPHNLSLARSAAVAALALASLAAHADVAAFSQSGSFAFTSDVHSFNLDIDSASDLRLWTTSYAGGQADPALAFFDIATGALLSLSDDVDNPFGLIDPAQGALDAGLLITDLAPGRYQVAVSLSTNLPTGSTWAEGYQLRSQAGVPISSTWRVQVALTNAAPIPEPTTTALLLAGLMALGWMARRRS